MTKQVLMDSGGAIYQIEVFRQTERGGQVDNEQWIKEQQKILLKRLKQTKPNETICLAHWQIEILLNYIEELKGVKHE